MPTPFTHLEIANRLYVDSAVPETVRALLAAEQGAYLLGSICADATSTGVGDRETTHFYRYDQPMLDHPWRIMLTRHPTLRQPTRRAQQAFVAGYVAHLAADEYWSRYMLKPHFVERNWGDGLRGRFFVLNLLITVMDERDLSRLTPQTAHDLRASQPDAWLPFMPDAVLCEWRDFIAEQITGTSLTLDILGRRILVAPDRLRAMLDDSAGMQLLLWDHITPPLLAQIEEQLYLFSREQMLLYLAELA